MHYLEPSLSFANQYPGLAYIMVFLTALAESALLAGMIVPGGIMVFAFAAMVATGQLALWPVLLMAIAGAMAGDSLGYWLGYRSRSSHAQLRIHRPFSNLPYFLGKADDFLARHGRDPVAEFSAQVDDLVAMGMANRQAPGLVLSRPGLIQVDRMLPRFFEPEHRNYKRYT